MLDCEQSLFSQSSLSAAGLERASASCFSLSFASLASLDFLARVSILRDCLQSTLQAIDLIQIVIKPLVNTVDVSAEYDY